MTSNNAETASLDDRIRTTELRLIAREERLHRTFARARQQVQRPAQMGGRILPWAGGLVGVVGAVWMWRRNARRAAQAARRAPSSKRPSARTSAPSPAWPVVPLLGVAWPFLPAAWQRHVSPATAATLAGFVVPALQRVFSGSRSRDREQA